MQFIQTTNLVDSLQMQLQQATTNPTLGKLLKDGNYETFAENILVWSIDFAGRLAFAFILFVVGRFLIGKLSKIIRRIMDKRMMDKTLKGFLDSVIITLLYVALLLIIINTVGTKTISIAALIASAGLAIGLAVKDNLANFAGGVMILFNKPFRTGDYITAQSLEGTVENIGILYTTLKTFDNKTIFIPNGPLSTGNIINNNSKDGLRRTDITVNMEYGCDIDEVKSLLMDIANQHPLVLDNPVPFARMTKMNNSSVDFTFRVWTRIDDFWGVNWDLNETIYKRLSEKGLNVPFQQMTVHIANDNKSAPE